MPLAPTRTPALVGYRRHRQIIIRVLRRPFDVSQPILPREPNELMMDRKRLCNAGEETWRSNCECSQKCFWKRANGAGTRDRVVSLLFEDTFDVALAIMNIRAQSG